MSDILGPHKARLPDLVEPIIAWRAWSLNPAGLLRAVYHDVVWKPGQPMIANCPKHSRWEKKDGVIVKSRNAAPRVGCGCGINACRDVGWAANYTINSNARVMGCVMLWGKVNTYEQGWRAEYGYPTCLFVLGENSTDAAALLSELYGVPVTVFSDARAVVEHIQSSWMQTHRSWVYKKLRPDTDSKI